MLLPCTDKWLIRQICSLIREDNIGARATVILRSCLPLASPNRILRLHRFAIGARAALTIVMTCAVGVAFLPVLYGGKAGKVLSTGARLIITRVAWVTICLRPCVALVGDQFADAALQIWF